MSLKQTSGVGERSRKALISERLLLQLEAPSNKTPKLRCVFAGFGPWAGCV